MSANINYSVQSVPLSGLSTQSNLYQPSEVSRMRMNKLIMLYDHARLFKQSFERRWKRNYEYYNNIDYEIRGREKHQSKIFVPRPYMVVETKTPKMVQNLLSKDPVWTVKPQSRDDLFKARVWSEASSYQLRNQDNIMLEQVLWFKDSFIFGGSVGMTGWEWRKEFQQRREIGPQIIDPISMSIVQSEQTVKEWVTTVDRPYFKNIDIGEIFPDPYASDIEGCNYVIRRNMVSYRSLEQYAAAGIYENCDKIPRNQSQPLEYDDFASRRFSLQNINGSYKPTDPVYDLIELLECWWIDEFGRKMKTIIANKAVIIQDIPLPYWHNRWPYYLLKDVPMTNEFWGIGEIDPIVDLCKELNDLRNQQNDNRNQFLKAFWVADRNANVDLDQLENMPPGGILEVTGTPSNAIQVIRPPQLDTMTFGAEAKVDSDIQITSGANDIAIGQATRSQQRTATTSSLLAQSTDTRFGLTALLYLEQMRKVGRDWIALNQQFMSKPLMVRVLGQDGVNMEEYDVSPYDIPRQFDVSVALGSEFQGDQDLQRQQSMQLFSVLAQVPGFNVTEYAKEILYKFNEKNPERFFEGNYVVPTSQIMQQLGIDDSTVQSSYQEQMAGMKGGGMQSNPRQKSAIPFQEPGQAASRPDVMQMRP